MSGVSLVRVAAALLACAACGSSSATSPPGGGDGLQANLIATGLSSPTDVDQPPGDTRLFVCEQNTARVRIIEDGQLLATPFLDIGADASQGNELGLLSLVFHPSYAFNRRFYVSFTDNSEASVVREYQASASNPNVADVSTMRTIFGPLAQPDGNHNGGCLQFGPDGMLYLSLGDGGECCADPSGRAQDVTQAFGKILRFDVSLPFPHAPSDNPFFGMGGDSNLVWALGLRNPWRFSFDSESGDLWVADVGDSSREEVSHRPAGSAAGANFGWNCTEGMLCTGLTACTCGAPSITLPVHDYVTYSSGTCAVIGGYVYRGASVSDLAGRYVFADICSGQLWSLALQGGGAVDVIDHTAEVTPIGGWAITSFGEGADGELYVADGGGRVWRLDPASGVSAASYCELTVLRDEGGSGSDGFGSAVSVAGDAALVGADASDELGVGSGAAHVFRYDSADSWAWAGRLLASDGAPGDAFGSSVAVDGDLAVIGAPFRAGSGGAYVFERTLFGGWIQSAVLLAADGQSGDQLGRSVDVSGPFVVAGAPKSDPAGTNSGAAYVFESTASGSVQRAKLVAADGAPGDELGFGVAISGDTIALGAHFGGAGAGAVHVFERDAFGAWVRTAVLTASDGAAGDRFGAAVALEGDTLLVGASGDDDAGTSSGAAYVFARASGAWMQLAKWTASDGASFDQFGVAVALSGDWAVVGALGSDQGAGNAGAAYVFRRQLTVWKETGKLLADSASVGDQLGRAVAVSGPDVLLATRTDPIGASGNGAARLFQLFGEQALWGCPLSVSLASGGVQELELDAGAGLAVEIYWLLGSASGTSPGLPGGGFVVPLNLDGYFLFRAASPGLPPLQAALGALDSQGQASASFELPPGLSPALAGTTLHHAYVVLDAQTLQALFVSNPTPVKLGP